MGHKRRSFFYKEFHKHPAATLSISIVLISISCLLLWISTFSMPSLDSFESRKVSQSTKIYDRTGKILLYDVFEGAKRTIVPFDAISRNVKNATVAIEDSDFYQHLGVRPLSFIRATLANLSSGSYGQGGSTITQQVVKNALLTTDKSISRKLKEWVLAFRLEKILTKDEILSIYLNETSYGGNIFGVEEASKDFFDKSAKDLTLAESAYLAAIPQATTYYSPYGKNLDKLENRKNLVLSRMKELNFISLDEYDNAMKEKVVFVPQSDTGIRAPHFVLFVKNLLEEKFGKDLVETGGLSVITTLDWTLEEKAEEIIKKRALENKENFNAENAALTALDPKTGEILAMVGSRDYFDKEIDGNFNVALGKRQPGSTMKPIIYAEAFTKGYTPETVLFDVPTEFSSYCDNEGKPLKESNDPAKVCYNPSNYDEKFRGPITLREALAQSINIPAIKTLYLAGIPNSIKLARSMGLSTLVDPNQYGLTLVLGGGEVTLLELTNAYGVFANDGVYHQYQSILSVKDSAGNVIYDKQVKSSQVLDPNVARKIQSILSDNKARTPAYGSNSVLYFPNQDIAVKTGTTNDYKDAWTIGFSPNLVVGVWAGNNNNSPMEKKVAGQIVAPIWSDYMRFALSNRPKESFTEPEKNESKDLKPILRGIWQGGESFFIDKISQKLATENTPEETTEERIIPNIHSILYWVDKNNPTGQAPINPSNDSQFDRWEFGVQRWVKENNIVLENNVIKPTESDNIHIPQNLPNISLSGISDNDTVSNNGSYKIFISNSGKFSIHKVVIYLNGNYHSTITSSPFSFDFKPSSISDIVIGKNEVRFIVYDTIFNKSEKTININVQ